MNKNLWGLLDGLCVWVHHMLPRSKDGVSPFFAIHGRHPNLKQMAIHPWGCPVAFKPMSRTAEASTNKNRPKAAFGYYAGIEFPKILVWLPTRNVVVSVSRKTCNFLEGVYAMSSTDSPLTRNILSLDNMKRTDDEVPRFVRSIKQQRKAALLMRGKVIYRSTSLKKLSSELTRKRSCGKNNPAL